jgi:DNA mismatch repair protein MLH1
LFYVPEKLPSVSGDADDGNDVVAAAGNWDVDARRKELGRVVETAIFPVVRKRLIAPKTLLGAVTEVANLKGLYRIFERSC